MQKARLTKTLSLERSLGIAIEKIAQKERRSFTRQVELMLESALARQNRQPAAGAEPP
jgi:hypothetical protein